jgi:hypothetical protein
MAKESGIKKQEPGEAKAVPIAIGRLKAKGKTVSPGNAIDTNSAFDTLHSELKELTTDHSSLTTKMEVHHHPEVEKKTFKQYLLEGLMIFLAVFMGFIAENIREKVADHEREQQYMESLVRDLALDTVTLKAGFPVKEKRIEAIDTVFLFFETHAGPKTIPFNIYRNIRRAWWDRLYTRNTGTIDQLKNAGGLRLIRKTDVRDSLATYDWLWGRLDYYKEAYYAYQQLGGAMAEKLVNANDLVRSYRLNSTGKQIFPSLSDLSIIRINTANLGEYLNFLNRQKITTIQDEQNFKRLEGKAVLLIKMIKKEYDLE